MHARPSAGKRAWRHHNLTLAFLHIDTNLYQLTLAFSHIDTNLFSGFTPQPPGADPSIDHFRPCHSAVHRSHDNEALGQSYHSIEALLADEKAGGNKQKAHPSSINWTTTSKAAIDWLD